MWLLEQGQTFLGKGPGLIEQTEGQGIVVEAFAVFHKHEVPIPLSRPVLGTGLGEGGFRLASPGACSRLAISSTRRCRIRSSLSSTPPASLRPGLSGSRRIILVVGRQEVSMVLRDWSVVGREGFSIRRSFLRHVADTQVRPAFHGCCPGRSPIRDAAYLQQGRPGEWVQSLKLASS